MCEHLLPPQIPLPMRIFPLTAINCCVQPHPIAVGYLMGSFLGGIISQWDDESRGTSHPNLQCLAASQAGSTNPCHSGKSKTKKQPNQSEVLLSLSLVFNCRSKLALQAGAACQQLLPGRIPGHPLDEGCPSHALPAPLLLPALLGSIRAFNPPGVAAVGIEGLQSSHWE